MRLIRIVGARPQFIQAAVLRQELDRRGHEEFLVHTEQHYDSRMSQIFFDELEIPAPDVNLEIGSGSHAQQTGRMMEAIERVLKAQPCDAIVVDGDTNSTLASALTAAKLRIPVVRVEAGLRSFDRGIPEEINRLAVDHIATLLCAPTPVAMSNLRSEGVTDRAVLTGDLLHDCFVYYKDQAKEQVLERLGLEPGEYVLCTVLRASNTDDRDNLKAVVSALCKLSKPVAFPVHPRTRPALEQCVGGNGAASSLRISEPVSYLEMLALRKPVICYIRPDLKEHYPPSLPIVSATPENIAAVIEEMIERRDEWSELGHRGVQYVREAHDSIKIARRALDFYESEAKRCA